MNGEGRRYDSVKRLIDLVAAAVALVVLSPVLVVISIAVRLRLGPPILFRQVRPGRGAVPFTLLKFRTMLEGDGPDHERLTSFGRRLRSTSLDELPELVNVLRGEMSLVGPRPLLVEYLPLYSERQGRRHEVRPGLTGLAQVSGRNDLGWDERLDLDVQYVDDRSLLLDTKIVWRTLGQIVRRSGIAAEGEATMPRFTGSGGDRV